MKQQAVPPSAQQHHAQGAATREAPIAGDLTGFIDTRASAVAQRKMANAIAQSPLVVAQRAFSAGINNSPRMVAQRKQAGQQPAAKPNNTGLPDQLKSGVESLSGMSMDSVKVHYNSSQPAQLNALAYAQGSDIHVGPGQEQHLPHEAWHVVQQAQGRVQPTKQMKDGVPVNDDRGLEHEADVMGAKALQMRPAHEPSRIFQDQRGLGRTAQTKDSPVAQLAPQAPPAALPAAPVRSAVADGQLRGVSSYITENAVGDYAGTGSAVQEYTPGYAWIQHIGKTKYWVNFHLVNAIVGGRGLRGNLTPTSKATNSGSVWRTFEERCKTEQALRPVHVAVEVGYHAAVGGALVNTRDANIHFFPNSISARLDSHDGATWNPVVATFAAPINPLLPPPDAVIQALSALPSATLQHALGISAGNAGRLKVASTGAIKALENDMFIGGEHDSDTPEGFYYYLVAWNDDDDDDGGNSMLNAAALAILKTNIFSGLWEI